LPWQFRQTRLARQALTELWLRQRSGQLALRDMGKLLKGQAEQRAAEDSAKRVERRGKEKKRGKASSDSEN